MRSNLATVWRDPSVQKTQKTNRRKQDIEAEVLRGYELARETVESALSDQPGSWELVLAQAALEHDENNYRHDLKKDPEFSKRRAQALASFQRAARLYADGIEGLEKDKETSRIYELWFYAALGACELKDVDQEKILAQQEIPEIRKAILALPGERAERHLGLFANTLFTRMSNASPAVKFRYVREGLAITGDHPLVREAKDVYDYYSDLVTEIQLRGSIDGSDRVGHEKPFGLAIDIRHTKEIERESGGFGKYLQNQNAASFAWNYGRPPEDYRDKFESAAREALQEHFEVLSVTFNAPEAKSRADEQYGWRLTPYAYILLKARGPEVDRVPPIRLDLDFLDTTGYAVIPVETAVLPIDAKDAAGDSRPFDDLTLTQTLDERQAKDGKLLLEVKAGARGLVPDLAEIAELAPAGFEVVKTDDQGVSVVKFDEEGRGVNSERVWTISMRAQEGLAELPGSFGFPKPKIDVHAVEHFRYADADLASVGDTVDLEASYGRASRRWMWWIPAVIVALAAGVFLSRRLARPKKSAERRFRVPDPATPFTVLGFLREIERLDGLAPREKEELGTQIVQLERHYFVPAGEDAGGAEPDLRRIAERWAGRTA
jgi:hypothetical protein